MDNIGGYNVEGAIEVFLAMYKKVKDFGYTDPIDQSLLTQYTDKDNDDEHYVLYCRVVLG